MAFCESQNIATRVSLEFTVSFVIILRVPKLVLNQGSHYLSGMGGKKIITTETAVTGKTRFGNRLIINTSAS